MTLDRLAVPAVDPVTLATSAHSLPGAVAFLQIAAAAWLLSRRWRARNRVIIVLSLLAIGAAVSTLPGLPLRGVGLAISGLCHACAYGALLAWFAASLRPGRVPVVTDLASRIRRSMPDKVRAYTRRVTIAWSIFFGCQLLLSAVLLAASPAAWAVFINGLNLALLAGMTLAEFACRRILFRHEARTGLLETLSAMRRIRLTPASPP